MVRTYAALPGKHLLEAIDLANESFGIKTDKPEQTPADNTQSLRQLEQMMSGVR